MKTKLLLTISLNAPGVIDIENTQFHPLAAVELMRAISRPYQGLPFNPYSYCLAIGDGGTVGIPNGSPLWQGFRIVGQNGDIPFSIERSSIKMSYNAFIQREISVSPIESIPGSLLAAYGSEKFSPLRASIAGIESLINNDVYQDLLEDNSGVALNGDISHSPGLITRSERKDFNVQSTTTQLAGTNISSPVKGILIDYENGFPSFDLEPLATNMAGLNYISKCLMQVELDISIDDAIIAQAGATSGKLFCVYQVTPNTPVFSMFPTTSPTVRAPYSGSSKTFPIPGMPNIQFLNIMPDSIESYLQGFDSWNYRKEDGSLGNAALVVYAMQNDPFGRFNRLACSPQSL